MTERHVSTFFKYDPWVLHANHLDRKGLIYVLFVDAYPPIGSIRHL
jgi:hypothetical protein